MAQRASYELLQCPYCGGELELDGRPAARGPDVEFGTLRCRCYRYGIVLGVVVLRQASPPNDNSDPIVAALDNGDHDGAVDILLANETAAQSGRRATISRIAERLKRRRRHSARNAFPASETLRAALRRWRPDHYGEYLEYRYANPSLLTAMPVIAAMTKALAQGDGTASPPWAIDIGCGIGHTTYLLKSLVPAMRVVAARPRLPEPRSCETLRRARREASSASMPRLVFPSRTGCSTRRSHSTASTTSAASRSWRRSCAEPGARTRSMLSVTSTTWSEPTRTREYRSPPMGTRGSSDLFGGGSTRSRRFWRASPTAVPSRWAWRQARQAPDAADAFTYLVPRGG